MSTPILAGYDAQSADPAPVRFAAAAARATGAPLVVASIHADHGHRQLEHGLNGRTAGLPAELLQELEDAGTAVEHRALAGASASRALHDAAEELDARLLVVGSAGGGRVGRVLLGSTAQRLLHGASCPVAVVPHGWKRGATRGVVGVAYVDTPEGRAALAEGLVLARSMGATLRVLSAAKPHGESESYGGAPTAESMSEGQIGGERRMAAELDVGNATAGIDDVPIDSDVSVQDPAEFLIAASERLDLLVCGSRGYGPRRAVLLGGVTSRVTADAACPVLVLVRGANHLRSA